MLQAQREEPKNVHDRHAVASVKEVGVVGHVPRKISNIVFRFLPEEEQSKLHVCATGARRFADDLPQGGLDVPCKYIVHLLWRHRAYLKTQD